jgi:EAL domain-containing protein (putative c-di-GMP-specific phosphodiesterase class I)
MGGDEFVVLLPVADAGEASVVGQRIVEDFRRSFVVAGQVIRSLTMSVGVSVVTAGIEPAEALRQADAAMYHAKSSGRNRVAIYDHEVGTAASRQQLAHEELRDAITGGQIRVYYQPILALGADGSQVLDGFEAMARWHHPVRGLVGPDDFIELAEETGLIDALGATVTAQALQQLQAWPDSGLTMSVNVSARELTRPGFVTDVLGQLVEYGISPERLCLEVTESQMMEQPQLVLTALSDLNAADVRIAIDDFGIGYSSLAYVRNLPASELKIDKSFVAGLPDDPKDVAVVAATIRLAHSLGMRTVAEGVETVQQLEQVRELGSDFAQGFLLGVPLPSEALHLTDWA